MSSSSLFSFGSPSSASADNPWSVAAQSDENEAPAPQPFSFAPPALSRSATDAAMASQPHSSLPGFSSGGAMSASHVSADGFAFAMTLQPVSLAPSATMAAQAGTLPAQSPAAAPAFKMHKAKLERRLSSSKVERATSEVIFKRRGEKGKCFTLRTNLEKVARCEGRYFQTHRRTASAIECSGVTITPEKARSISRSYLNLRKLTFSACVFYDDSFGYFRRLEKVTQITLIRCRVNKQLLDQCGGFESLKDLQFKECTFEKGIGRPDIDKVSSGASDFEIEGIDCHYRTQKARHLCKLPD